MRRATDGEMDHERRRGHAAVWGCCYADRMSETCDIAIVGGGAAGLAAAIFAAEARPAPGSPWRPPRVVLLDGANRLGAKILVAGGGRCNVTHHQVSPEDYFTSGSRKIVRNVLRAFDVPRTVEWFASMGVELKREPTGKLFPTTDKAQTVLDALLGRCAALGLDVRTGHRVGRVACVAAGGDGGVAGTDPTFTITHARGELRARRLILATGGRSLPRTGSDGGGYDLARALGHSVTPTHAALVPLVLDDRFFHAGLSGVSCDVELGCYVDGKRVDRRAGAMLFTHFGVSGPVVMDVSRHWLAAAGAGEAIEVRANFRPGREFAEVERAWVDLAARRRDVSMGRLVGEKLPERVAEALLGHVGIDPAAQAGHVTRDQRRALVHALTGLALPIVGERGWNHAEATAGGVPLDEIDYRTMGSRRCAGLYLVGEVLDVDGRIGGFNFQWAWATGHVAGRAAASDA